MPTENEFRTAAGVPEDRRLAHAAFLRQFERVKAVSVRVGERGENLPVLSTSKEEVEERLAKRSED